MERGAVIPRLVGAGLFATLGLAALSTVPAGASTAGSTVLPGSASPAAALSPAVAPVASTATVNFELTLNPRDGAGAQALAKAVATPGSPDFRRYLTPAQWEARFSPTPGAVAAAAAWLRQQGFTLGSVSGDRMAIEASGSGAQVEHAFSTSLSYHVVQGQTVRLAGTNLSVPTTLAGIVSGAIGISQNVNTPDNTTGAPTTTAPAAADPAGDVALAGNKPSPFPPPPGFRVATPCGAYYGQKVDAVRPPYGQGYPYPLPYAVCGYVPGQLRSAYGVAAQVEAGQSGQGVTVAITDAYASPTLLADAQHYAATEDPSHPLASTQFSENLPSKYTDGALCGSNGWYGEQTLDVEAVHAMAPGANILYVGGSNCVNGLFEAVARVVDGHLAQIITNSWGDNAGDLLDPATTRAAFDNTLLMAAGTGVSVLFSSGDNGDQFSTVGATSPDYPPSSPYATAVGGTTLQIGAQGQRLGELGWSTARSFLCTTQLFGAPGCSQATENTWLPPTTDGGSGGGTSYDYVQPYYQVGIVPAVYSTANSPVIGPTPTRVVPDISMEADPGTGFLVGETQTFPGGPAYDTYRIGGTSVASPLLAGVIALSDQAAGTSLGFVNPALYKLSTANPSAILDVVPGGKQAQSRVDFANSINAHHGKLYSTRIITYEGTETYCNGAGNCATRTNTLNTAKGYDNMTGLGAPANGFVGALAKY